MQAALTVDSIGFLAGLLCGAISGGFRGHFRGHVGLSFCGLAAAGRGRGVVRWEIVRFVVGRPLLGKGRRPTLFQSPISDLLIGLLAFGANEPDTE